MIYVDLVLDNGGIVRVQCPDRFNDEFMESIDNARRLRDWWSPERFEGCRAEFIGMYMARIDMSRVVGML